MSCSLLCVDTGVQTKWPLQQLCVRLASVPPAGKKHNFPFLMSRLNVFTDAMDHLFLNNTFQAFPKVIYIFEFLRLQNINNFQRFFRTSFLWITKI